MKKIVIAIDGPAASGKSTTAKLVAERLGYLHLDTGAMYRAITLRALRENVSVHDAQQMGVLARNSQIGLRRTKNGNRVFLLEEDVTEEIRTPQVSRQVSAVSSHPTVRAVLVEQQRRLARDGGVVLEGRDIGTVVFPTAELKIFMVADISERARRRRQDLAKTGVQLDNETVAKEIADRDTLDSTREASPLKKADDAIKLDTSGLTIAEQVDFIVSKAMEILQHGS
ncbi:MAG: (d)CMP kinase [Bacteroidota bacterium]